MPAMCRVQLENLKRPIWVSPMVSRRHLERQPGLSVEDQTVAAVERKVGSRNRQPAAAGWRYQEPVSSSEHRRQRGRRQHPPAGTPFEAQNKLALPKIGVGYETGV